MPWGAKNLVACGELIEEHLPLERIGGLVYETLHTQRAASLGTSWTISLGSNVSG